MSAVTVQITDYVSPEVARFISRLKGAGRVEMHGAMGTEMRLVVQFHLRQIGQTRHATANRLGAKPTGHWQRAVEKVSTPEPTSEGASIAIRQPGITRALRDVRIAPTGGKKFLTIPIHALSYGKRVREVERQVGRVFRPVKKGARKSGGKFPETMRMRILAAQTSSGLVKLYALSSGVTQKQDRTLLPSTENLARAGAKGAVRFLFGALKKGGRA